MVKIIRLQAERNTPFLKFKRTNRMQTHTYVPGDENVIVV